METRSGTGGSLPPVAGLIAPSVVRTRPDLKDMGGYIVRVPRSLDIDMNEDSQRVWVQAPADMVEEEGPVSFPTIVLSADELRLVTKCEEGFVLEQIFRPQSPLRPLPHRSSSVMA